MREPIHEASKPLVSDPPDLLVDVVEVHQQELRVSLQLPLAGLVFHFI